MISVPELAALLPAHLAAQRWFGDEAESVSIASVEVLRAPWPALLRVEVIATDRWQLLLGLRRRAAWGVADVGEVAAVGRLRTERGPAFCYDALVDPKLGLMLLAHIAPDIEVKTVRPMMVEQSNTSLVFDERWFLKVFRRLIGANPDAEVAAALAAEGFSHVAAPRSIWRVGSDDCAVLAPYLAAASEGWAMALASLRDFFGGDDDRRPGEAGGDFAPEAARLGALTAQLHEALAAAFGATPGQAGEWAVTLTARMAKVTHPEVDQARSAAVAGALAGVADPGSAVRTHGDYHLGQVLYWDDGWYVVDFEGEPAAAASARQERSSPLRDVAGMLRSFHYAALVAAREHGEGVVEQALAWEARNRQAFLAAYQTALRGSPLIPADPASFGAILVAYELDKAVYEVGYEQAHRPDWVSIPLAGVRRLGVAR